MRKVAIHNGFYDLIKDIEGISLIVTDHSYVTEGGEVSITYQAIDKEGTHYFIEALQADYSDGIRDDDLYIVHMLTKKEQSTVISAQEFLKCNGGIEFCIHATPLSDDEDGYVLLCVTNYDTMYIRTEDELQYAEKNGERYSNGIKIEHLLNKDSIDLFSSEIELHFVDDYLDISGTAPAIISEKHLTANTVHYEKKRLEALTNEEDRPGMGL